MAAGATALQLAPGKREGGVVGGAGGAGAGAGGGGHGDDQVDERGDDGRVGVLAVGAEVPPQHLLQLVPVAHVVRGHPPCSTAKAV